MKKTRNLVLCVAGVAALCLTAQYSICLADGKPGEGNNAVRKTNDAREGGASVRKAPPPRGGYKPNGNMREAEKKDFRKKDGPHAGPGQRPDNRNWGGSPNMHEIPRGWQMAEFRRKHPEYFELIEEDVRLEKKTAELAGQWKNAQDGEKGGIKNELTEVATKHFKIRQDRRLYELRLMEEKIQDMRKDIERRNGRLEKIIHHRVKNLLEKDESSEF